MKTPKPVIAEDSNYYTEEQGYSFTVLDTQYKPQITSNLYETDKFSSYDDVSSKPSKKSSIFGGDQDHVGFNYSDTSGKILLFDS